MRIDLHTHSTASDGTLPPAGVIAAAAAAGLDVVALTDHDTTSGWAEAVEALPPGMTLIRGAELSCAWYPDQGRPISVHVLAYLFDPDEPALRAERERVRAGRVGRARRMVELMAADGHPVTWAHVLAEAGSGSVGRPHVARALVRAGLVPDFDSAFVPEWIGQGGKYRVDKPDTEVHEAVRLVRAAGGVPVIAHSRATQRGATLPDDAYPGLAAVGLAGLEADHLDHDEAARARVREIAGELGLFVTGSSDFHGANKPIPIGVCTTAVGEYQRLLELASGTVPVAA